MEARRKRPHPGFVSGEQTRYGKLTTPAQSQGTRTVRPTPGTDLTTPGGVAAFDFVTGRNEFIRFLEQPITIGYQVHAANADYNADADAAPNNMKMIRCNLEKHPEAALNPGVGASPFITSATVSLDAHVITEGLQLAGLSRLYKAFNTLSSTEEARRADGRHLLFKTDADRKTGANLRTASCKAGMSLVHGTSATDTGNTVANTSLDGYPMLGRPRNNALNEMDGRTVRENINCFIPPSTRVSVLLHLNENPEASIEWATQADEDYFKDARKVTGADPPVLVKQTTDCKVSIKSLELSYESFVPESEKLRAKFHASSARFHVDIPRMTTAYLNAGAQHCVNRVNVPEGAKLGYLAYCYSHAVWPDATSGRGVTTRLVFPGEIEDVRVELVDHGPVGFESSGKLAGPQANKSTTLRNMVLNLRRKGLTTDELDDIFPPAGAATVGYLQALMLDLSVYNIAQPTALTVSTTFSAAAPCPRNLYLVSCFVQEGQLSRGADKTWRLEPVKVSG